MARSGGVHFPFEEDLDKQSLRRAQSVEDTIASSIKAFLLTDPGSRRGNPIGSFVPSLRHKTIPSRTIPQLEDELQRELTQQFPGVTITQVSLTPSLEDDVSSLKIGVLFSTPVSDFTELIVEIV